MTIDEIRQYRALTSGGFKIYQLHEVSIEGIKKFRERFHKPAQWYIDAIKNKPLFSEDWLMRRYDDPLSAIYDIVWGGPS